MTPPILNVDARDLQPWGDGVSVPGAGQASERYQARKLLEHWQGE
jgi:hypothetical protein